MDGRGADLDRDDGVEHTHGGLEGYEVPVLVGEDAEVVVADAETYTSVDILLAGLEPRLGLCLSVSSLVGWSGHN